MSSSLVQFSHREGLAAFWALPQPSACRVLQWVSSHGPKATSLLFWNNEGEMDRIYSRMRKRWAELPPLPFVHELTTSQLQIRISLHNQPHCNADTLHRKEYLSSLLTVKLSSSTATLHNGQCMCAGISHDLMHFSQKAWLQHSSTGSLSSPWQMEHGFNSYL